MNIRDNEYDLLSLDGSVAVVSGGASGIGLGVSMKLALFGAKVIILDKNAEKGIAAEKELKKKDLDIRFIECDVRLPEQCKQAIDKIFAFYGRIDILFNNAGIAIRKNAVDLEPDEWDLALDVSLKGQYLLTKYTVPVMKASGGGSIINTGSGWSLKGGPDAVSYCAVKGGTLNMTRAMAIDFGKYNIRVNCVCPGDIDTPMLKSECEQLGGVYDDEYKKQCASGRPIERLGTVDDVANAVLFLSGRMSEWITGTHLVVDGGGIA
jgi:NAD(P)-dependent dehydrogenase (short-subunit alcohol dehydrogenase family)